jgi:hypothetical protein
MGLALLIALPFWVGLADSPVAAGCDPHGPDQPVTAHAYMYRNWTTGGLDGARTYIYQYRPYLPFEFPRRSAAAAYVALVDKDISGSIAQIGWNEYWTWRKSFLQYYRGAGQPYGYDEWNPEADWTYTDYMVSWDLVSGVRRYRFWLNGVLKGTSNVSAFVPDRAEVASEINNFKVQMPGGMAGSGSPFEHYDNVRKRVNGAYSALGPTAVNTVDNTKFYASNQRGGMDPSRELVTADRRGDCAA